MIRGVLAGTSNRFNEDFCMKKTFRVLLLVFLILLQTKTVCAKEIDMVDIIMVGDCLIHTPLYEAAKQDDGTYDFSRLFENVTDDISKADIAIINQETIFVEDRNKYSSYPMFGSPIEVGVAEVNTGFDVVACATNHTLDKGIEGVNNTLDFWKQYDESVYPIGIHSGTVEGDTQDATYLTYNNITFAFVNYTYGLNGLESRRVGFENQVDMLSDEGIDATLKECESNADVTVAILHIGEEYRYTPTEYQISKVDWFIDNGADIIFCAHPHVVEPYELHYTDNGNKGLVFYSVGNFVSAQDEVPRCLGGMAKVSVWRIPYTNTIEIRGYTMLPLVTHQERGYYTTYKLSDYTEELASRHRLRGKGLGVEKLKALWSDIVY